MTAKPPTERATAAAEEPAALLACALNALARGDLTAASAALRLARDEPVSRLEAHNLIETHGLEGAFGPWIGVPCNIAPRDDIFRFFETHPTSVNPLRDYFADGWRTLAELMVLLEQVQRPLLQLGRVLEFASGHGRFTRHLAKTVGAERVVVADVVTDAVEFSKQHFGVQGSVSTLNPSQWASAETYDLVFVLSLFSHLPAHRWQAWLSRLAACVAPGGLLVFTTHGDEALRKQGMHVDASGFAFVPASESQAIEVAEYGTTFTSQDYVANAIASLGTMYELRLHSPAHFWAHQDAYVIKRRLMDH